MPRSAIRAWHPDNPETLRAFRYDISTEIFHHGITIMPRKFTDNAGREWSIVIGLYTAQRIKELSDGRIDFVDTSRVQSGRNALIEMSEDVELCGRVLWWLVEDQATAVGVTERQFGEAFDLDVLDAAQTALAEALIDFFPSRLRDTLRRAAELARKSYEREMATVEAKAEELTNSPEFEQMIDAAIRGQTSGSSPDLRAADPLMYTAGLPNSH
ncbi:MAG: hypothetical protein Fues2KO_47180 [Fuerstiella sp.]